MQCRNYDISAEEETPIICYNRRGPQVATLGASPPPISTHQRSSTDKLAFEDHKSDCRIRTSR
jgi:hypothetical protein